MVGNGDILHSSMEHQELRPDCGCTLEAELLPFPFSLSQPALACAHRNSSCLLSDIGCAYMRWSTSGMSYGKEGTPGKRFRRLLVASLDTAFTDRDFLEDSLDM